MYPPAKPADIDGRDPSSSDDDSTNLKRAWPIFFAPAPEPPYASVMHYESNLPTVVPILKDIETAENLLMEWTYEGITGAEIAQRCEALMVEVKQKASEIVYGGLLARFFPKREQPLPRRRR